MPTTGMTTAMAVFAPVSSPLLPPVPLLELSFARAAAEEDAAAASSALVVEEGAALVAVSLGWSLVIVTLTTTVLPLVPSAGLVGAWVITDVMTCVVPSAEGAVDVRVTSAEDSGAVVSSAVVSSGAEDVEDVAGGEEGRGAGAEDHDAEQEEGRDRQELGVLGEEVGEWGAVGTFGVGHAWAFSPTMRWTRSWRSVSAVR